MRPVVTIVNSLPHLDQNGDSERTTGFGDTVLGVAAAASAVRRSAHGRRRPDVHFSDGIGAISSARTPGRSGLMSGATLLGKHFIAYGFVQQWFKVGGDGRDTNQMSGVFNFTYLFENGWTIGTQPTLSVDWKAPGDEASDVCDRTTGRKDLQMRRPADAVPGAGSVLPGSSKRRRSEVEYSAASDADDSGPHQENALLTRVTSAGRVMRYGHNSMEKSCQAQSRVDFGPA